MTAPIGSRSPQDTAFRMPWITLSVSIPPLWLAAVPEATSRVAIDERSSEVVGWMVGE